MHELIMLGLVAVLGAAVWEALRPALVNIFSPLVMRFRRWPGRH